MAISIIGIAYWLIIALAVAPLLFLARGWYRVHREMAGKLVPKIALVAATASYLLLFAEILRPETWGQYRSTRLATISINCAVSVACLIASGVSRSSATGALAGASVVLVVLWMLAAVINVAV